MLKIAFVLKSGAEFAMRHAERLAEQVDEYLDAPHQCYVLTDSRESFSGDGARLAIVPLRMSFPGWWSMIEMFRIPGDVLYLDLDCSIVGPLDPLAKLISELGANRILMIRAWNRAYAGSPWCTGLTAWSGDRSSIFDTFVRLSSRGTFEPSKRRPDDGLLRAGALRVGRNIYRTDEQWTPKIVESSGTEIVCVRDALPGFLESYKYDLAHGTKEPRGSIVMFHGVPRPWEVGW